MSTPPHTESPGGLRVLTSPGPVIGSVCTGVGGLDLGVLAALGGGRIVWCADPDPHITTILKARLPGVPNLGDITRVDWTYVEPVEVLTAGFPCQDISSAGRRVGIEKGTRSGLWTHIVVALRHLRPRPRLVVVENVAALRWRRGGLHCVLADLAAAGFDALWRSVRASDIGAAHRRERVFLLAWPHTSTRRELWDAAAADPDGARWDLERDQRGQPPGRALTTGRHAAAADSQSDRRHEGLPHPAGVEGGPDAALSGGGAGPRTGHRHLTAVTGQPDTEPTVRWGVYASAIRRWEHVLGRPAPAPTQPGRHGRPVLAPPFVEHLMGLPTGWVTDLPLPRTAQLRALGNSVMPQQAAHGLGLLLVDLHALRARSTDPEHNAAA